MNWSLTIAIEVYQIQRSATNTKWMAPFSSHCNEFMAHKTGFSAAFLGKKLVASCFVNVQRRDLALCAIAYKPG